MPLWMFLSMSGTFAHPTCEDGDVDGDTRVDWADIALIQTHLLGFSEAGEHGPEGWDADCAPLTDIALLIRGLRYLVPAAPVATAATNVVATGFRANWQGVARATGYRLDVATDSDFIHGVAGYSNLDAGAVLHRTVCGLPPATRYHYRVRACNAVGGASADSNPIEVTTLQAVPLAPTATAATQIGLMGFQTNWNPIPNATGYRLDVRTQMDGFSGFVPGYNNLSVGDGTAYPVVGLSPGITYTYRVRAYNELGTSENSNTISVTTLPQAPPSSPVAAAATDITLFDFRANWTVVSDAKGYRLDVATDNLFSTFLEGYENCNVGLVTDRIVSGLNPGTTYFYRVRATNIGGASRDSNTVAVSTLTPPPPFPSRTVGLPDSTPLEFVLIPAGSFIMGSPQEERGRIDSEGPLTHVTFSRAYYMSKYPVTQRQWIAVMGASHWFVSLPEEQGRGDENPMHFASYEEMQNFIGHLNSYLNRTQQCPHSLRLPTEGEWEYACRAGTTTRFSFGDSLGCDDEKSDCAAGAHPGNRSDYMWYGGNIAFSGGSFGFASQPVGQKQPNAFGLYDMHGNVYEMCSDWYHAALPGGSVIDPTGPATGTRRVLRGGYWGSMAWDCRSARRVGGALTPSPDYPGFRLVSTVTYCPPYRH